MGRNAFSLALIVVAGAVSAVRAQAPAEPLRERIERSDPSALEEAAKLDPEKAIPLLTEVMDLPPRHSDLEVQLGMRATATRLLREIPGHAEYLEQMIESSRTMAGLDMGYDEDRGRAMSHLRRLGTDEAVRVLGGYLFDWAYEFSPIPSDAAGPPSNAKIAAGMLHDLNLPDAPVTILPRNYQIEHYVAWIRWWEAKYPGARVHVHDPPEWARPSKEHLESIARSAEDPQRTPDREEPPAIGEKEDGPVGTTPPPETRRLKITLAAMFISLFVLAALIYLRNWQQARHD